MQRSVLSLSVAVAVIGCVFCLPAVQAEVKPEHRKQLNDIKKELGKVQTLLSKKQTDEATKILNDSEAQLKQLCTDAGIQESDKLVVGTFKLIEMRRLALSKRPGAAAMGVTFEKDVSPILVKSCLRCHDDQAQGGLNMSTFEGIIAGGANGPIISPGNIAASNIVRRITSTGRDKMPRGQNNNLTADEIKTITTWVQQGAKFAGDNKASIRDLASATPGAKPAQGPVEIPKPTGNETVSFSKDIAPWMNRLCVNCHSGQQPRSGFSLATFELLMKGGNSGRVLLPGNPEDSRLWHLVGKQDPIKMPPGQALITETNWENLRTWIEEGCKFDGQDPKAQLATLVPSAANERAKLLASWTAADWEKHRKDSTQSLWTAFSKETMNQAETKQFLVVGDVPAARLKQVGQWADEHSRNIARLLGIKEDPVWKGRLAIFVFKERFGIQEFLQTHESKDLPNAMFGFARVNGTQEQAYIAVQDVGDTPGDESPGLNGLLYENLTMAAVLRSGRRPPEWIGRGMGLVLASRADQKNAYYKKLPAAASAAIGGLETGTDMFKDGTFDTADQAAVAHTIVAYMLGVGGDAPFVKFVQATMAGSSFEDALRTVYSGNAQALYNSIVGSLPTAKPAKKTN